MTNRPLAVSGSSAPGAAEVPAQRTMGVAVLGTGSAGMRHLEALEALRRRFKVEPIAVPRRAVRATELAGRYTVATRLEETPSRGAVAAIIATDTGRHVEDGLAAMACGLDLLVEKPLSVSAVEASRLRARAVHLGRRLFVGCTLRFSESLNAFRSRLGDIGQVHSVRVESQSFLPEWRPARPYQESYSARTGEGGVLLDLIHEIDYAGWIFGWPRTLQARLHNLGRLGIGAEERAELTWETSAGGVVSLSLDYLTRPPRRLLRACGEWGTIEWDGLTGTVRVARAGAATTEVTCAQTRDEMFLAQAQAFVSASQGTVDPRLATGDDGVQALAVCDAARLASVSGRQELVEYPEGLR